MRNFKHYLTESTKTYKFRIKVACDIPKDFNGVLRCALDEFQVLSSSAGKNLPIASHIDFPQCGPTEVNVFNVELGYPTTDQQVLQVIHNKCGIPLSMIRVLHPESPYEIALNGGEKSNQSEESVLDSENMDSEDASENVGIPRLEKVLKDLEKMHRIKYEFATKNLETAKTTNDFPAGNVSPIGSIKTKA